MCQAIASRRASFPYPRPITSHKFLSPREVRFGIFGPLVDHFDGSVPGKIQNMSRCRRLSPLVPPLTGTSRIPCSANNAFWIAGPGNVCIRGVRTSRPVLGQSGPGGPTNFDTLKVVQRLEAQGFTPEQSKAVMELLKDVIDESVKGLTRTMVTREEQDKVKCLSACFLPSPFPSFSFLSLRSLSKG
jgi:hypothetical protein